MGGGGRGPGHGYRAFEGLEWSWSGLAFGLAGGLAVGWPFGLAFGLLAGVTAAQLTVRLRGGRAGKGSVRVTALPRSWASLAVGLMSCLVVGLGAGLIVSQDGAPSLG